MTTIDTNHVRLARAHRAMWMNTIREGLEHSVPIASDSAFDDLLAQLDKIPSKPSNDAAKPANQASVTLARREAAFEAHLSGYIERLAEAFRQVRSQVEVPVAKAPVGVRA